MCVEKAELIHCCLKITVEVRGSPSRNAFSGTLKVDRSGRLLITAATVNNIIRFYLEANGGKLWRPPSKVWGHKGGSGNEYKQGEGENKWSDDALDFFLGGVKVDKDSRKEKSNRNKKQLVYSPIYPILTTSYLLSLHPVDVQVVSKLSSFASKGKKSEGESEGESKGGRNLLSIEYVPYALMGGYFTITCLKGDKEKFERLFGHSEDWTGVKYSGDVVGFLKSLIKCSFLSYRTTNVWFDRVEVEEVPCQGPEHIVESSLIHLLYPDKWARGVNIRSKEDYEVWKGGITNG